MREFAGSPLLDGKTQADARRKREEARKALEAGHPFATLWLRSGEHPEILQEILGYSRISVTLDTYSHVISHMQRDAMGRFGKMFAKPS